MQRLAIAKATLLLVGSNYFWFTIHTSKGDCDCDITNDHYHLGHVPILAMSQITKHYVNQPLGFKFSESDIIIAYKML